MQVRYKPETVFGIHFEFERTGLIEVRVAVVFVRLVAAGAYRAYGKSTKAVGTSDVELLAVWCVFRIAIAMYSSNHDACGYMVTVVYLPKLSQLGCALYELGIRVAQDVLVLFAEFLSECTEYKRCDVSGRCYRCFEPCLVAVPCICIVVKERVLHGRNELVAEAVGNRTVSGCNGVELGCCAQQHVVRGTVLSCV